MHAAQNLLPVGLGELPALQRLTLDLAESGAPWLVPVALVGWLGAPGLALAWWLRREPGVGDGYRD